MTNKILKQLLICCLKFRKNTKSKNPKIISTKNGRMILLWKCSVCNSKKSKFLKEQEARRLLSNLMGIKIPTLSDLPTINTLF